MYIILREWKELAGQLQDTLFLELGLLPTCQLYTHTYLVLRYAAELGNFFHLFHPPSLHNILIVSTASDPRLVSVIAAGLLQNTSQSSSTLMLNFDRP
jgi:hypothetical protein